MNAPTAQIASTETPLRPKLPLRLGRFTLCEELGAGGMATVYLARMGLAAGIERLVALKTIHPHLAREKAFVDMFLDEARIASHVSHPNVCAVHDFGEVEGVYYLGMEHLLGEPLFDVINRLVDRFDEVRDVLPYIAARVVADACEGLHAAHTARGPDGQPLHIVHRDVSPQNLFVTYDGAVKVVDFGCAKAAQRVAHTSTGVMKGKVGYAAPEQLRGEDVDARADVWALGVCLWESLTLSPLFTRETAMKTAMAVLEAPVALPSLDRPWVPEPVARIAAKALSRPRDERYASARDLGRELRKFIADSGYTLESAELAEWMEFLFEDRRDERARQAARVRELDVSDASIALPEMLGDVSADDVELLPDSTSALELLVRRGEPRAETSDTGETSGTREASDRHAPYEPARSSSEPPRALPARSRRRWPLVLLALVALAVGGYYAQLYYEPAPWFLELVGAPEARPGDPPPEGSGPELTASADPPESDVVATPVEPEDAGVAQAPPEPAEVAPAIPDSGPPRRRPRDTGRGVVTTVW